MILCDENINMVEYFAVDAPAIVQHSFNKINLWYHFLPVVIVDPIKIGVSQFGIIPMTVGVCQLSVEPINVGVCQLCENVVSAEVPILVEVIIVVSNVGDIISLKGWVSNIILGKQYLLPVVTVDKFVDIIVVVVIIVVVTVVVRAVGVSVVMIDVVVTVGDVEVAIKLHCLHFT